MAIAGRVAIVPKGEYSNEVTYDKLDLVMFNNDAYVAKKASTGIEPTNDEYWMLILNNVVAEDLENIINGTTAVGNALKLGGKGASEYVQNTSTGFVTETKYTHYDGLAEYGIPNVPTVGTYFFYLNKHVESNTLQSVLAIGDGLTRNVYVYSKYTNTWEDISDGGNADTVDGTHAWNMQTVDANGNTHGNSFLLRCQYDVDGDGDFKLVVGDGAIGVKSGNADMLDGKHADAFLLRDGSVPMSGDLHIDSSDSSVRVINYQKNARLRNQLSENNYFDMKIDDGGELYHEGCKNGNYYSNRILHTGNSQKVVTSASAPSDTSALWVDTTNKKVKAYIDGAWTAMA